MAERSPPTRVQEHLTRLRECGLDPEKFFDALGRIREDRALGADQREVIQRLVAMESMIWYLEAIRDEPIDRARLLEDWKVARDAAQAQGQLDERGRPKAQNETAPAQKPTSAPRQKPRAAPRAGPPRAQGRRGPEAPRRSSSAARPRGPRPGPKHKPRGP